MSSGTEAWDRLLAKKEQDELPEITEQLKMLKEREDRSVRIAKMLLVVAFSIVLMVVGVMLIGDWSNSFMAGPTLDKLRLEVGILLTLFGTVILTTVMVYLLSLFKRL